MFEFIGWRDSPKSDVSFVFGQSNPCLLSVIAVLLEFILIISLECRVWSVYGDESLNVTSRNVFVTQLLATTDITLYCILPALQPGAKRAVSPATLWARVCLWVPISYLIKIKLVEMYMSPLCILLIVTELPWKFVIWAACSHTHFRAIFSPFLWRLALTGFSLSLNLCHINIYMFSFIFHSFTHKHQCIDTQIMCTHTGKYTIRQMLYLFVGVFKLISLSPGENSNCLPGAKVDDKGREEGGLEGRKDTTNKWEKGIKLRRRRRFAGSLWIDSKCMFWHEISRSMQFCICRCLKHCDRWLLAVSETVFLLDFTFVCLCA